MKVRSLLIGLAAGAAWYFLNDFHLAFVLGGFALGAGLDGLLPRRVHGGLPYAVSVMPTGERTVAGHWLVRLPSGRRVPFTADDLIALEER